MHSENSSKLNIKGKPQNEPQQLLLTRSSSSQQVRQWLESIGDISEVTINALSVLTGSLLFQLTKQDLQQICDNDWRRIYSHLNIQKNLFEKSHSSQLEEKLKQIRIKNETTIGVTL